MDFDDPTLIIGVAKASRAASRLVISNGVFALVALLLLVGSLTLQLTRDHSVSGSGASAHGE
jgi:hypothetical protein